ncbi:MAG: DUF3943 domain-containing protein [Thiovulaceae bacterium]|nr:DUF3943 domain-containing protein [Sulfurimonadaceae bacterium]
MRIISLFLSLLFSLPLFAVNTLYDDLRQASMQMSKPPLEHYFDATPEDDTLHRDIQHYRMRASLKEQFEVLNGDEGKDYIPEYVNVNEKLPYRYRKLIEDSIYLQVVMISAVGVLAVMPKRISGWDITKLQEKSLQDRWQEHVQKKPVWDKDHWSINYIGHPVAGAIYYTIARNDGMSVFESAAYSTLTSTFFWEYGYEAFAEVPSIQDLIVTPLFGSFLGEGMYVLEGKLDKNGGMIWGSALLGNISYFFLNPMGNMANGMSAILKRYNRDLSVTMTLQTYPRVDDTSQFRLADPVSSPVRFQERDYGFIIILQ